MRSNSSLVIARPSGRPGQGARARSVLGFLCAAVALGGCLGTRGDATGHAAGADAAVDSVTSRAACIRQARFYDSERCSVAGCGTGICVYDRDCNTCAARCNQCRTNSDCTGLDSACPGVRWRCAGAGFSAGSCEPDAPSDAGTTAPRAPCGDRVCGVGETCASCPADCGACPLTRSECEPCVGDSECGAGLTCGTRRCDSRRACFRAGGSCPTITGVRCPTSCGACAGGGDCPSGTSCRQRVCDGRRGCYPSGSDATCPSVGGVACPAVSAYNRCASDSECGARALCVNNHCVPRVPPNDGCPPIPQGTAGVTITSQIEGSGAEAELWCWLRCERGARCPYGMTCESGYCR